MNVLYEIKSNAFYLSCLKNFASEVCKNLEFENNKKKSELMISVRDQISNIQIIKPKDL